VSSVVSSILGFIEASVEAATPSLVKSKNYYDLNKNDGNNNAFIYAVRPSSASPISGVTRSATIEQDFELEIVKEFTGIGNTDQSIRDAVEAIYEANEAAIEKLAYKSLNAIIKVGEPSFSAPSVNDNQKYVSIVFTYPITFRKSIQGDS